MNKIKQYFLPFNKVKNLYIITIIQIVLIVLFLEFNGNPVIPKFSNVLNKLSEIVLSASFYDNLFSSIIFIITGFLYSLIITVILGLLCEIPFFRFLVQIIVTFRYLSVGCLMFVFSQNISTIDELKTVLLLYGVVPFFATSFVGVILAIPTYQKQKALINKYSRFEALYEVVLVGQLDKLLDCIIQNFAIAWSIIVSVEGYAIQGGGLGTMIVKMNRVLKIDEVLAVGIVIIVFGCLFDFLLRQVKVALFPYALNKK